MKKPKEPRMFHEEPMPAQASFLSRMFHKESRPAQASFLPECSMKSPCLLSSQFLPECSTRSPCLPRPHSFQNVPMRSPGLPRPHSFQNVPGGTHTLTRLRTLHLCGPCRSHPSGVGGYMSHADCPHSCIQPPSQDSQAHCSSFFYTDSPEGSVKFPFCTDPERRGLYSQTPDSITGTCTTP